MMHPKNAQSFDDAPKKAQSFDDAPKKAQSFDDAPKIHESFDDAPQKASNSFDNAPKKPWVHFCILSDECLELPSDSVKKGITLKRFEKQCTVSNKRCKGKQEGRN